MDQDEYEATLTLLFDAMEGGQGKRHEIFMRLQQIPATMRAEGLPVPEDLEKMEKTLAAKIEAEAANNG